MPPATLAPRAVGHGLATCGVVGAMDSAFTLGALTRTWANVARSGPTWFDPLSAYVLGLVIWRLRG